MKDTILFIVAHSDDHVLGGGGTIAKYVHEKKRVISIVLSYGEKSHPWLKQEEAKKMRFEEAQRAGKLLGCATIFFDLKEGKYIKQFQEQGVDKKIKAMIAKYNPSKVFTHSSDDPHPDHRAALQIVNAVVADSSFKPEVFSFAVWNTFTLRRSDSPKLYVDISDSFRKKLAALRLFRSQLFNAIYPLYLGVLIRAVRNGLHINKKYAERFSAVRQEKK